MQEARKSSSRSRAVALLVAVVALMAVSWMFITRTARTGSAGDAAPAPLAAENASTLPVESMSDSTLSSSPAPRSVHFDDDELTVPERAAKLQDAIRKKEAAFISEPLDASWAAAQIAMVNKALTADSMAQFAATPPRNTSVDCRSHTCRIVAVYADQDQAEVGQYALTAGIGNSLSGASSFMVVQPDGPQQLVIYATAAPPSKPKSH